MQFLADITEESSFYPKLYEAEQQVVKDSKRLNNVEENLETNMDEATFAVYKVTSQLKLLFIITDPYRK
jgi:hypothetical protein